MRNVVRLLQGCLALSIVLAMAGCGKDGEPGPPGPPGPQGPQGEPGTVDWAAIIAMIDSINNANPGQSVEVYTAGQGPASSPVPVQNHSGAAWISQQRWRHLSIPGGLRAGDDLIVMSQIRASRTGPAFDAAVSIHQAIVAHDNAGNHPDPNNMPTNMNYAASGSGGFDSSWNPSESFHFWVYRQGAYTWGANGEPDVANAYVSLYARAHNTNPGTDWVVNMSPTSLTVIVVRNP